MDYPSHSRVHRLPSFDTVNCSCWVKRDDELGFGISGSKIRKYSTLIPFLLHEQFQQVIAIGGINSNNILGLSQLLTENRIPFKLYLKGDPQRQRQGNGLLTSLIAGAAIRWVNSAEWPHVHQIALDEASHKHVFIIPEGASCPQALPGALTLATDIKINEEQIGHRFDHIFIDAGTGFTANALAQQISAGAHLHVVMLAEPNYDFSDLKHKVTSYQPRLAPSFGSVNQAVWDEVKLMAQQEGILTDPVYSAKLFHEARHIIREQDLRGNALVIHGGGGLSLLGFSKNIEVNIFPSC
ncbi:MAG: pyridoxal-phosphate dependent enzyme [Chlamydiales bacterium]|nr:pyridoxal-phosphate dependent enzyme [Chlamydiales bacterium]